MSYPCFNQAVLINVVTAMSSCGMTRAWPLAWIQNWMKGQKVVNTKEGKKDSLAKCGFSNCGLTLAWAPGSRIEWIQCGAKTCELATQKTEERFTTEVWFLKLWLDPVGNMKALLWTEVEKPTTIPETKYIQYKIENNQKATNQKSSKENKKQPQKIWPLFRHHIHPNSQNTWFLLLTSTNTNTNIRRPMWWEGGCYSLKYKYKY